MVVGYQLPVSGYQGKQKQSAFCKKGPANRSLVTGNLTVSGYRECKYYQPSAKKGTGNRNLATGARSFFHAKFFSIVKYPHTNSHSPFITRDCTFSKSGQFTGWGCTMFFDRLPSIHGRPLMGVC
jgi:hypothetical protein